MITGETTSGFEYSFQDDILDNWELLEALYDTDNGHPEHIVRVVRIMFDKEQGNRLRNHVKTEDGRIPAIALIKEVREILTAKGKNS